MPALKSKPTISEGLWIWEAYNTLNSERPAAFGGIPSIPWSKALEYASFYGLTRDDFELMYEVFLHLDDIQKEFRGKSPDGRPTDPPGSPDRN